MSELIAPRIEKLSNWKKRQNPYPDRFEKKIDCAAARNLAEGTENVQTAGRIMLMRQMGKLTFIQIQDNDGRYQIALQEDVLGAEEYGFLTSNLDIGDYVGVAGTTFMTMKKEPSLRVMSMMLLGKSLHPLPDKWQGVQDEEIQTRQKYLDYLMNEETRQKFRVRSNFIKYLRRYLEDNNFTEIETPILQAASSGAMAEPFVTHHNALDTDFYLRIAPETYLKRAMVGGYERIFEIGKNFRNEGIGPAHLQEFTMLEYYASYWNYRDNMKFTEAMLKYVVEHATGGLQVTYEDKIFDFSKPFPEIKYNDLVKEHTGVDLNVATTLEAVKTAIKAKGLDFDTSEYVSVGTLIDTLYKRFCRPHLIQPCFLTMHPTPLIPLARASDANPDQLDMFQVVVNGWELVKGYSELVNPIEQKERLLEQQKLAAAGDAETMMMEDDFIEALSYGLPPVSGTGIGIDRMICLLTNAKTLREIVLFPPTRPKKND
jgi:lysyl-tRNA synthetase class 2